MSEQNEQLAVSTPRTVKEYLALPAYRERFNEVLNKRAPQFMAAITAVSQMPGLKDADPRSVIAAAMVSATLDLPVNPTLGQSHIVAYRNQDGESIAQFQIGFKGLIQLALRSGQYRRMNAGPVNAEVFSGYDMVGEPTLDWTKFNPVLPVGGYFCAFELVNGFTKVVYWSKAQVEAHAKRFSKAYQKGYKSSPWFSDFDSMATKTVIKNALTKWGMLSVEMQSAVVHDQGAQTDVDADVKYVDGEDRTTDSIEGDPASDRPAPKPRSPKGAAIVKENAKPAEVVIPAEEVRSPAERITTERLNPGLATMSGADAEAAARAAFPEDFKKPVNPLHAEGEKIIAEANAKAAQGGGATANPAQTAKPPSPARSALNAGEVITVEAQVEEYIPGYPATMGGKQIVYTKARITSPEYAGEVCDLNSSPLWTLDAPLRLTLKGNGKRVFVDRVEALGDTPAAPDEF